MFCSSSAGELRGMFCFWTARVYAGGRASVASICQRHHDRSGVCLETAVVNGTVASGFVVGATSTACAWCWVIYIYFFVVSGGVG